MTKSINKFKVAPGYTLLVRDECGFLMSWTKRNASGGNFYWPDHDSKMLLHFYDKEELLKFIFTLEHMFGVKAMDISDRYPSCVLAVEFKKIQVPRNVLG